MLLFICDVVSVSAPEGERLRLAQFVCLRCIFYSEATLQMVVDRNGLSLTVNKLFICKSG